MALAPPVGLRIRVLGKPAVAVDGGWVSLSVRESDLLVALALSSAGRHVTWLRRNLWKHLEDQSDSTVPTHASQLRRKGAPLPKADKRGFYRLDCPDDAIDARRFVDGVRRLGTDASPTELDELLRLWSGNPWESHSQVPGTLWAPVRQALDTLLDWVQALGDDAARLLPSWGDFEQMMSGEELVEAVRSPVPRPAKRKVLIVDDQIGYAMADVLGDYEAEVIDSLAAWNLRKDQDRPFHHVCALVDLHLKPEMTDRGGLTVVRDLQERSKMPIVLLSAELPPFEDFEALRITYGVQKVLPKHNRTGGDFARLSDVVRALAG